MENETITTEKTTAENFRSYKMLSRANAAMIAVNDAILTLSGCYVSDETNEEFMLIRGNLLHERVKLEKLQEALKKELSDLDYELTR